MQEMSSETDENTTPTPPVRKKLQLWTAELDDIYAILAQDDVRTDRDFWRDLSHNRNLPLSFIERYMSKPWDWNYLSYNPNITPEFVTKHHAMPWNWSTICSKEWITMPFLQQHLEVHGEDYDWIELSFNHQITLEFVQANVYQEWNWKWLCSRFNIELKVHLKG